MAEAHGFSFGAKKFSSRKKFFSFGAGYPCGRLLSAASRVINEVLAVSQDCQKLYYVLLQQVLGYLHGVEGGTFLYLVADNPEG